MTGVVERLVTSQGETETVAERLGRSLAAGDLVLLYGDLGAGKTTFVRGLARGLDTPPDVVSSPTFTLVQEYAGGRVTLYHVDLYRLEPGEVEDLGLDELLADAVVAVEWADRWAGRPADAIDVHLEYEGHDSRRISIRHRATGRHTPTTETA